MDFLGNIFWFVYVWYLCLDMICKVLDILFILIVIFIVVLSINNIIFLIYIYIYVLLIGYNK